MRTDATIYINGAFYTITHNSTNKKKHINEKPFVAICGEWVLGHGNAESLGYICNEGNKHLVDNLRKAFISWHDNGHTNENDINTVILKITVTEGIVKKMDKNLNFIYISA